MNVPWLRLRYAQLRSVVVGWCSVPANLVLAAIALFLVAAASAVPVDRKGDGAEYILTTESLYYDHDLVIKNTVDIFRHIDMRPQEMDTPAGLTRIQGTDGVERFGLHSFYYSLVAVPFYAVFGYHGFYILNAVLIVALVAAAYEHLARRSPPAAALCVAAGGVFLSAAWSYVFWTQTEPFYCALIALYLYFWCSGRPLRGAIFMGIAMGAQFPLALLGLPLLAELVFERKAKTAMFAVAIFAACVAPQVFYDLRYLGTLSPMVRVGLASPHFVSFAMWLRLLVDPTMGLVWFYPVVLYCLIRWRPTFRTGSLLVAIAAVLLAMTSVRNIYSHQVGARYGCYALPVFLFSIDAVTLEDVWSRATAAFTVVVGAGLAINPLGNSRDMDVRHKTFLPYRVALALGWKNENPEVFRVSSDRLVPDRVFTRGVTVDRWSWGNERAELMIVGARPGELELDLRSYPGEKPEVVQPVEVDTMSGARSSWSLRPSEVTHVTMTLSQADVRSYARWGKAYAYVGISASGWSPAIILEGHPPEAHDIRMLGVQIERIALDGEVLFTK